MAFIPLDQLSGPSKVAILKLCISNVIFVVSATFTSVSKEGFSLPSQVFFHSLITQARLFCKNNVVKFAGCASTLMLSYWRLFFTVVWPEKKLDVSN